jgi:hypothetical protein
MSAEVRMTGPLFDGSAARTVDLICDDVEDQIGQTVFDAVRQRLRTVLVNPTGYYESRVQVNRQTDSLVISDSGVVYGPWLEGTGSRNGRSRFKGYATFRKVSQQIASEAVQDADRVVAAQVGRLQ